MSLGKFVLQALDMQRMDEGCLKPTGGGGGGRGRGVTSTFMCLPFGVRFQELL